MMGNARDSTNSGTLDTMYGFDGDTTEYVALLGGCGTLGSSSSDTHHGIICGTLDRLCCNCDGVLE